MPPCVPAPCAPPCPFLPRSDCSECVRAWALWVFLDTLTREKCHRECRWPARQCLKDDRYNFECPSNRFGGQRYSIIEDFQAESAALPHARRRTSESFDSEILEVQRSSHRHLPIGPVGSILDADIGFFYIAQTRRLPTTLCAMTIFRTRCAYGAPRRSRPVESVVLPTRCVECERCEVWRQGPGCKFRQSTASANFKLTY